MSGVKKSGFTLVELMVVLAIIALLSGITFISVKSGRGTLILDRSIHQVAQDVRKTTEYALRTRPHTCGSGVFSGYGIYIETITPTSYLLFAKCATPSNEKYSPLDEKIEDVPLEKGVRISSISVDGSGSPGITVTFFPPDLFVEIRGDTGPSASGGVVTLEVEDDPTKQRTITVNEKGIVTIGD